jgi:hypothetical protein
MWGDLMAMVRKDKWDVYMLMNMCKPPAEGNLCDELWKAQKPAIIAISNHQMVLLTKWTEWLIAIQLENMEVAKNIIYLNNYMQNIYKYLI